MNDSAPHPSDLAKKRIDADPYLGPYYEAISHRVGIAQDTARRITEGSKSLEEFALGHLYFGIHRTEKGWVVREWAPNAIGIYLKGEFNGWKKESAYSLNQISDGVWELHLDKNLLKHGTEIRFEVHWPGGFGDRIPAWIRRTVYHSDLNTFNGQIWAPEKSYEWKHEAPILGDNPLLVYETHIGMAQAEEKVGSYKEFKDNILPRIKAAGYNCLQLMAIAEHPYYASFGYQVANFFAPSSRFGTPEELKELVDEAHRLGLIVLMDIIHSHSVKNEIEGLARFDGTSYQYFHEGGRGDHPAWDSKCFDYSKAEVLHFLLSNCRYWLDEFHFDGFRFDGVTSMLYHHHGLGVAFTHYDHYFNEGVDLEALTYLHLANDLIHRLNPNAITIAEDVSGMPGLAAPAVEGGIGFDYRYAMGVPDYWIKLTKDTADEAWPMGELWHEVTNRRSDEATISYAESHDQALVGDKTLIFRLLDAKMYDGMAVENDDHIVFRGMSLHKMIRLLTFSTAGQGYLNFMGNEFGHPEWIDFPREGNEWSYKYARRQWQLADDPKLKYSQLGLFDKAMLHLGASDSLPDGSYPHLIRLDEHDKVIAFSRGDLLFAFNFHSDSSYTDYHLEVGEGAYTVVLDTDHSTFGGHGRQEEGMIHESFQKDGGAHFVSLYLPSRSAIVLRRK